MAQVTRREFMKITGMAIAGSSLVALGFTPQVALAEVRQFKLARATETRNTCPYCSVACGILMYSLGDGAKNAKPTSFTSRATRIIPSIAARCARRAPAARFRPQ